MIKRVLVTGAEGFIGQHLVTELEHQGMDIVQHTLNDGDLVDCKLSYTGIDHVFHLGALTSVPRSWESPQSYYNVNVMGTENVLEYCRIEKCSMTFMSTYVYGHPQYLPIDENHPISPNSPYNHSKYLAEMLCRFYNEVFGVCVTVLRPFNIYGIGQASNFLVPELLSQLLDPKCDNIHLKSLYPKRDYVYIDDVISALICTLYRETGYSVYNIGSGKSVSVKDLADIAMKCSGIIKPLISAEIERKNEVTDICASTEKAQKELGWSAQTGLTEGLSRMIALWK